ncbi:MAG TPA: vWA domain-containing protein [Fibrobacteria bacterium]|nr:vWA domain-containing protein [Fibrobacteria bacterium]
MSRAALSSTTRRDLPAGFPGLCLALPLLLLLAGAPGASAQSGEAGRICEVKPAMRCLDKEKIEGTTLKVPLDAAAVRKDGFQICDSSFNYTTAPDIVLIMDNTGSMDSLVTIDGIPRWCDTPDIQPGDPGCISGDPHRLRGPALQAFLDSALVKGGKGINVGVVTFSLIADAKSDKLLPLTAATKDSIKASIEMEERGETNYTAAFRAALDLLKSSHKPKQEQFVIFVSDGRPNYPKRPDGDPYAYKTFWDSLPTVHSIFLGDNKDNYKDMQDVSGKTGGLFFNISDVSQLARILTDDLARKLFRRAAPTLTTVWNLTDSITFEVGAASHKPGADSGAYTLLMPGPLELAKGVNDIVIKTEYGYGGTTQDVHFKIERSATGPYFTGLEQNCRDLPKLIVYNAKDEALNLLGLPYTINDSALRYALTTGAEVDSFDIVIRTKSSATAQQDLETVPNSASNRKDTTWTGSEAFQHQTVRKTQGDDRLQIEHGEIISVSYRNPYIREDSATVRVKMKYGPEFDKAAYRDLDNDGRIETITIRFMESLAALPDKLQFRITDATGASAERTAMASSGEIKFLGSGGSKDYGGLVVTLDNPFPFGMTSVANADSSGRTFRQLNIPMVDGAFRVDDSVPPVILRAEVGTDKSDGSIKVQVTYSEPVGLAEPFREPLVFKRDTVVFSAREIPVRSIEKTGALTYTFTLAQEGSFKPVGGDSVAINDNGETRDLSGIAPRSLVFTPMGGPSPSQTISDLYVTFANGSKSHARGAEGSPDGHVRFIPVDSRGYPIPGNEKGKCGSCSPLQGDVFTGSVIYVVTKQPVAYDFSIFSNLGVLVARGSGTVEEGDLRLLDKIEDPGKDPNQTRYVQRIVWTGQSETSGVVGTGAYVLKAVFHYDRNFRTGAKASTATRITRFGFLRACCATGSNGWWD